MSNEYIGAIVLLLGAILKAFGVNIGNDTVQGIVAGVIAIWIAYRRYQKGDITIVGARK